MFRIFRSGVPACGAIRRRNDLLAPPEMFLEAGGDPAELQVMTQHFRPWLEERLGDGRYYGFKLLDGDQPVAAIGLMSIDWPPHPSHPTQTSVVMC